MKDLRRTLAGFIAVMSVMSGAVSCTQKQTNAEPDYTPEETIAEIPAAEEPTEDPVPFRGTSLTWLGDFDLNQTREGTRTVAMALFEDRYGCTVNCIQTDASNRYERLAEMINSGEQVDMFPFDVNAIPGHAAAGLFEPLDPYLSTLGYDEEGLWDDMKETAEIFRYNGSHYVIPYSLKDPLLLTYNRKIIQELGLDDPYQLYQQGAWDWNAFTDMMDTFKAASDGSARYGINGWFGAAALQSTGHTVIEMTDSGCVNNISDPALESAGLMLQNIVQNGLYNSSYRRWYPADNSTLFYAMEDWSLGTSNVNNPEADLMVVPFPKSPDADKQYLTCGFNAKLLVKNSQHPEAVAAFIKCERIAATQEEYVTAAKAKALEPVPGGSGEIRSYITEEQYDAIQGIMRDCTPVYDPGFGMGVDMYTEADEKLASRGTMNRITEDILRYNVDSWGTLRDMMSAGVDRAVELVNSGKAAEPQPQEPEPVQEELPEEGAPEELPFE